MAKLLHYSWFISLILSLAYDFKVRAVTYDHSFTPECLAKPLKPQYNGGIVVNPELNQGLKGWTISGDANVALGESEDGNKYIVASTTKQSFFKQEFFLDQNKLYTFSAWVQVSHGNADIAAVFKTATGNETAATAIAQQGCWSMLKGGIVVNASAQYELLFESYNSTADLWVDSISLEPFTQEDWKRHQDQSIEKHRKTRVQFEVVDKQGRPISNATVSITQRRPHFPFGNAINQHILNTTALQDWFLPRFKYTVLENEMKWHEIELIRGVENYSTTDAMVRFAQAHGIVMRGHTVLWDSPYWQPEWVKAGLSSDELWAVAKKRVNSVMSRYRGNLIHWDVVNENMHYDFYETKLGPNSSSVFYEVASKVDTKALPFLNEYNTIERSVKGKASPPNYMKKIAEIRQQGYNGPLGIGLQSHFAIVNLPYVRSAIDQLASTKLPIWITELDVSSGPHQVTYLEQVLKELHSHRAVEGIMMWASWKPDGCYSMCLTDNNFKNLPTGDVVDKFIAELTHAADQLPGTTDGNGVFGTSLFHGDYVVKISSTKGGGCSVSRNIAVVPNKGLEKNATLFKIVL